MILVILSTFTILIGLSVLGFGMVFLSAPVNQNSVYGSVTSEQDELGTNDDGDKKSYTDCQGYKEHTDYLGMTTEEADLDTERVDARIATLELALNIGAVTPSDEDDVSEELACLQAIRAIENDANATLDIGDSMDSLNYTPYSNSNLGISFEYPSTWSLDEKENRFELGPDLSVGDGLERFKLIKFDDDFNKQGVDILGLKRVAELTKPPDQRIIDQIEENKYSIDGEDTVSYTAVNDNSPLSIIAMETILVPHEETIYLLQYQQTQNEFDSPESQETLDHIIKSIRFSE